MRRKAKGKGGKGGCRECLDFGEIEESYLNITATAYLLDREKEKAFGNQLNLYMEIQTTQCLCMILNSQNATKHKNHKKIYLR